MKITSNEYLDWNCVDGEVRLELKLLAPGAHMRPIRVRSAHADGLLRHGTRPLHLRIDDHGIHVTVESLSPDHLRLREVNLRARFLTEQLFGLSFQGMAQRNRLLYAQQASAAEKEIWRERVFDLLQGRCCEIEALARMDDSQYVEWLREIQSSVNDWSETKGTLADGHWRVGSVQKLVNLWLKYLWCQGASGLPPPHFPVDGEMVQRIPSVRHVRWTRMHDWAEYQTVIAAARLEAGSESLAEWELREWQSPARR